MKNRPNYAYVVEAESFKHFVDNRESFNNAIDNQDREELERVLRLVMRKRGFPENFSVIILSDEDDGCGNLEVGIPYVAFSREDLFELKPTWESNNLTDNLIVPVEAQWITLA